MEDQDVSSSPMDKLTSQLSAHIWGHRFKGGQRGPEYVLEFLNVLFGADYSFNHDFYHRNRSVGLRKFIFEGVKEGSGAREILALNDEEKEKLVQAIQENNIHVLKQFLRNLEVVLYNTTGKEADRSWFARSLYPLHESLLYVELRKKGKDLQIERNFFARGGELYYLMLAHGTDQLTDRRKFIQSRFKELLTKNKAIEKVVSKISTAFGEQSNLNDKGQLRSDHQDAKVPYLPSTAKEENRELFVSFSEELGQLLELDIEIYEMFHLLTSLICFQLARYMHERSLLQQTQYMYFCDCLDGNSKPLLQLSARNFEQHENLIKARFEHAFEQKFSDAVGDEARIEAQLTGWKADPESFIELLGLSQMRNRKNAIKIVLSKCTNKDDVLSKLYTIVKEAVSEQLKKHQLNITRVLSRDGGFATYRRGSAANYRYTISDSFLQMLVFTKVKPKEKIEYYEFLDILYQDYHIVIGERQAKSSGVYDSSKLNAKYFQENEKALRNKLRHNGLLIEFSDATAMIQNPYNSAVEASYA